MFRREKNDLRVLLICAVVIPLVWLFFLDDWSRPKIGGDAVFFLPRLKDLLAQGGDWNNVLYRADIIGGVNVADIWGKNFLYWIAANLGLSLFSALNFAVLVAQVCYSFLGSFLARGLASQWADDPQPAPSRMTEICMAVMFGFLPVISARLRVGHLDMLLGFLFFLVLAALIVAVRRQTLSLTLLGICAVSVLLCIPSHGHQAKLYSVVFGGPILLALAWPREIKNVPKILRDRSFLISALLFTGAFLLALPKFAGMFLAATSSDSTRSLSGQSLIYSFMTQTWHDWLVSLTWNPTLIPSERAAPILAEAAFAFGPCLLLIPILFFKRARPLAIGLFVSLLIAVIFSTDIQPFSTLIATLVPPLHSFRVPGRSVLPFTLMLPIASVALILAWTRASWTKPTIIATVLSVALIVFLPDMAREAVLWIGLGSLGWFIIKKPTQAYLVPSALVLVLTVGMLASVKPWITAFVSEKIKEGSLATVSKQMTTADPRLKQPLTRANIPYRVSTYGPHSGLYVGLQTMAGYWNPMRRFLDLLSHLGKLNYPADSVNFEITSKTPGFPVLQQLYNVCCDNTLKENNLTMSPLPPTAGNAWFSQTLVPLPTIQAVANELEARVSTLSTFLKGIAFIAQDDPKTAGIDPASVSAGSCAGAQVKAVDMEANQQTFHVQVETPGNCPLTLAMNYSELLKAKTSSASQAESPAQVFPVYGALTGVMVPAGSRLVTVYAEPRVPVWSRIAWVVGLLCVIGSVLLYVKTYRGAVVPVQKTNSAAKKKKGRARA